MPLSYDAQPALDAIAAIAQGAYEQGSLEGYEKGYLSRQPTIDALKAQLASLTRRFPGDPGPGKMYYGASSTAQLGGRPVQPYRIYAQGGDSAAQIVGRCRAAAIAGNLPFISVKLPTSWAAVARGAADAWLIELAQGFATVSRPVWFTMHHEPRGDGDPADFRAMYEHAVPLMREHDGGNVAYGPVLNGYPFTAANATLGQENALFTPSTEVMDFWGFDLYNPFAAGTGLAWQEWPAKCDKVLAYAPEGVPIVVGEYGCRNDPRWPDRAVVWLQTMYDYCLEHGFAGVGYFNSALNAPDGPWVLDGARLQKWSDLSRLSTTARA